MIRETRGPSQRKIETRGCVDCGSSYLRLLVATGRFPDPRRLEEEDLDLVSAREDRRYAGWGSDLAAAGTVGSVAADRALGALAAILAASREAGCERPALVGTNTLRAAANAADLAARVEAGTGLPLRVLSQREEAALGFRGAAFFAGRPPRAVLVDAGGTSAQIAWGSGVAMADCAGLAVGVHTAHAALGWADRGAPSPAEIAARLEAFDPSVDAPWSGEYSLPPAYRGSTILVTGGTATALAMTRRWMRGLDPRLEGNETMTLDELAGLRKFLAGLHRSGRQSSLPFDADRIRLLPAGIMLLESLLCRLAPGPFAVTARDLRWGVVLGGEGESSHE